MELTDLDQVLEIEESSFPTPWSKASFQGELEENDFANYLVLEIDGRVIGYAGMWLIFDEAHITNVAIHPRYRGQKWGEILMKQLMYRATALGADRITLEVRPSNTPANRLYRRLGFRPVGIRKGYYTDTGEDAIIMWKHLMVPTAVE